MVVLGDLTNGADAEIVAKRVLKKLEEPIIIGGHEICISASIGIGLYPNDSNNIEILHKNADIAMYSAKKHGGNCFDYFSSSIADTSIKSATIETEILGAIESKEFLLHYQPLIDLESDKIVAVEALIRWQHPEKGLLGPLKFIPVAEESGVIVQLGEWVLQEACKQNTLWQSRGFPSVPMAINLSERQLLQSDIVSIIKRYLEDSGLDPQYLIVEVSESSIMANVDYSIDFFKELNRNGIQVAIDDYGSGYSSLDWFKKIPIDILKIDHFFTQNVIGDKSAATIVKAIIAIAHSMGIKVVAEGIENNDQLEFFRRIEWPVANVFQCDHVQGYHLSKPISADNLEKYWLKQMEVFAE